MPWMDTVKRLLGNPVGWMLFLFAELFVSLQVLEWVIPTGTSRSVVTVIFVTWAVALFVLNYLLRRRLFPTKPSEPSGRR
jgi:putative flippase GtrA